MSSMGFMGRYDLAIDPKGRLFLPPSFRTAFGDGGVITLREEKVVLYTAETYERTVDRLRQLRDEGRLPRPFFDSVFGNSTPFTPDSQGRVSIPKAIRDELGLVGHVTLLGTDECLSLFPEGNAPVTQPEVTVAAYKLLSSLGL